MNTINIDMAVKKDQPATITLNEDILKRILQEYILEKAGREVHDIRIESTLCTFKVTVLLKPKKPWPVPTPKADALCANCGERAHMHPYRNCDTFVS